MPASACPVLVAEAEWAIEVISLIVKVAGAEVLVELMLTFALLELEATSDRDCPSSPKLVKAEAKLAVAPFKLVASNFCFKMSRPI